MQAMRYKTFLWPNNPERYTLSCERLNVVHKLPLGDYCVQDLGRSRTVLRGAGEFFGAQAYAQFAQLLAVFADGGAGVLEHPVWSCETAVFSQLELMQEPRADHVAYEFTFYDGGTQVDAPRVYTPEAQGAAQSAVGTQYHTVVRGDTLWALCARYGLSMRQMLALNPGISDPNRIYAGEVLRVR